MELSGSLFHGAWLIVFSLMDSYTLAELKSRFLIYLPMMVFPESMLNGWIAAILVGFKPHWVGSFNDAEYIKGNDPLKPAWLSYAQGNDRINGIVAGLTGLHNGS